MSTIDNPRGSHLASAAVVHEYGKIIHLLRRYRELDLAKLKTIAGLLSTIDKLGSESGVQHKNLRSGLLNYPLMKTFDRTDPVKAQNDFLAEQFYLADSCVTINNNDVFLESIRSRDRSECGTIIESRDAPASSKEEATPDGALKKEVSKLIDTMGSLEEVVSYVMCKNQWTSRDVEVASARVHQQLDAEELSIEEIDRYFDDPNNSETAMSSSTRSEGDGSIVRAQESCDNALFRELQLRCSVTAPLHSYDLASLRQQHEQLLGRVVSACEQLCPFSIELNKK